MPYGPNSTLTDAQRAFVAEYLVDKNATQAAIRAGYSKHSAKQQGTRLLSYASVRAAIDQALAEQRSRTLVTADAVVRELAKLAFIDPRKFFAEDGSLLPVTELDDDAAAALAGMDVVVTTDSDTGEVTRTHKVKFTDKRAALVDLGKHLGIFDQKNQPGSAENPLTVLIKSVQGTALPVATRLPDEEDD